MEETFTKNQPNLIVIHNSENYYLQKPPREEVKNIRVQYDLKLTEMSFLKFSGSKGGEGGYYSRDISVNHRNQLVICD